MTNKQIKQLTEISFKDTSLDEKKVIQIVKLITKKRDFKQYINYLKILDSQKKIIVSIPSLKNQKDVQKIFKSAFPKKRILIKEDTSIVTGLKIEDGDQIFEYNIKNTLNLLNDFINSTYA